MRKLSLNLDGRRVDSFPTDDARQMGTVRGYWSAGGACEIPETSKCTA